MKNTTKTFLVVLALAIVAAAFLIYRSQPAPASPEASASAAPAGEQGSYTLAEVAAHKDAASCWTVVSGGVYDVTRWIGQHPGGREAILSLCGKDGTSAFLGQHDGERRPAAELATFKIGSVSR
ncbi:MAG TPA: cytochrome b5-like heme/steroid binding domain-containing protein [Candidatus Paceibacterota bacterium]|nr:cytochrome b5-like heme/steroid binding domain-containing protein [Candidatus Paceibacterota bacterium]